MTQNGPGHFRLLMRWLAVYSVLSLSQGASASHKELLQATSANDSASSPGLDYYESLPHIGALPPALTPGSQPDIENETSYLILQETESGTNYLLQKSSGPFNLPLLPITKEEIEDLVFAQALAPSLQAANNSVVQNVSSSAVANIIRNLTLEILEALPDSAFNQSMEGCLFMAEPWGQCGGISSCPETLHGQCLDQAWPTVCCPPANSFQQECKRVNRYYHQCLPAYPLLQYDGTEIEVIGEVAANVSMPHVGPNPDTTHTVYIPKAQIQPPPAAMLTQSPPLVTNPPPPLEQTVVFYPPPPPGQSRRLMQVENSLAFGARTPSLTPKASDSSTVLAQAPEANSGSQQSYSSSNSENATPPTVPDSSPPPLSSTPPVTTTMSATPSMTTATSTNIQVQPNSPPSSPSQDSPPPIVSNLVAPTYMPPAENSGSILNSPPAPAPHIAQTTAPVPFQIATGSSSVNLQQGQPPISMRAPPPSGRSPALEASSPQIDQSGISPTNPEKLPFEQITATTAPAIMSAPAPQPVSHARNTRPTSAQPSSSPISKFDSNYNGSLVFASKKVSAPAPSPLMSPILAPSAAVQKAAPLRTMSPPPLSPPPPQQTQSTQNSNSESNPNVSGVLQQQSPPPPPAAFNSAPPPPTVMYSPPPAPASPGLLWGDEFLGFANSSNGINLDNWSFQNGNGSEWNIPGWGNNELEVYTEDNVLVSNGQLIITANYNGTVFSSARLRTFGLRNFTPSAVDTPDGIRVEASIQLPIGGQGIWPQFWMLPSDSPEFCSGCGAYGSWPSSGEINIMEPINDMNTTYATAHYGSSPDEMISQWTHSNNDTPLSQGFHTYAVDWKQDQMIFSVDNSPYLTVDCACSLSETGNCGSTEGWYTTNPGGAQAWGPCAPFDRPFYIILNLAIGGGYAGNPTSFTQFPQSMVVDYVRVYRL